MELMLDNYHQHPLSNANNRPTNWFCNICRVNYINGSINRYRCNLCDFDLCENCKLQVSSFFFPKLHQHNLYDSTSRKTDWFCNNCRRDYSRGEVGRFRCHTCNFDVCSRCISYLIK